MGVAKEPVAVISVTPTTICVNDSITYDGTSSFDPDGAITGYSWVFGDGGSSLAGSGTHQYTTAGTYTVTLTVTDGTGLQGSASAQVVVNAPAIGEIFLGHELAGPYYQEFSSCSDANWQSRATGLTGNWLNIRDLKLNPFKRFKRVGAREIWIATQAGVAYSTNDMVTWTQITTMNTPRNPARDSPAPALTDLDWYCIAFNPMYEDEVYVLAGTATRAWVYWTGDGGTTWDNWQVCV